MFRDKEVDSQSFMIKFQHLKRKLDEKEVVQLDSHYHQELQVYIKRIYEKTCQNEQFDDTQFNNIRDAEMSNLNRLQKLKNGASYKKEKHKSKHQNEEWN